MTDADAISLPADPSWDPAALMTSGSAPLPADQAQQPAPWLADSRLFPPGGPDAQAPRVRPARRPAGWQPSGPLPPGSQGSPDLLPGPQEDLCYLTGEWRIFQRLDGHRWSLDDLVTAWYTCAQRPVLEVRHTLDLGCGIGSVLQMVAWRFPRAHAIGIEAQALSVGLARRSLRWNGIASRAQVRHGDLRDATLLPEGPVFDLVTGTPPYIPYGNGCISPKVQCEPCRFESRGGIEAYCEAAARALAPSGLFGVCESADQVPRVQAAAQASGLCIFRQLEVIPKEGKRALFCVFILGHPNAQPPRLVQEQLTVRDAKDRWTTAFRNLRADMGMPPAPPSTAPAQAGLGWAIIDW